MRRQVRLKVANLAAFREGNAYAGELQKWLVAADKRNELHSAHAIYAHVQKQMSVPPEQLLKLEEMKNFAKIIG